MKIQKIISLGIVAVMVGWQPLALAQDAPTAAAAATTAPVTQAAVASNNDLPIAPDPLVKVRVKDGTEVSLRFAQTLSSKRAAIGDAVNFTLDQDLKAGDRVVARKGATALGTVTQVRKSGMMGRGGELNLRLEYLKAGDTKIKLRGLQGRQGDNKEGAMIGLTLAFGMVGFLKHGKQAEIKEGTPLKAYVDQDTELVMEP